ncbi:SagB family peptide dehydrogenase [Salipaludibacillus aurantiacus]|uniref:SagB-type dehydrogenase domain-containing protein n=1 Tax=Salipaludibacillus aurantiacus TaxID=1601833 RepID=A0A1H9X4R8_9BACI|nr:SagB family peptide dehydrogenase [Salipaludibacillus aurantiacus]SES41186.1 SagB-type dehydrogenase domain-containing protein [Salipaludibacillus aurantiacus]
MKLDTFLHHLHFETDKTCPPDWEVNWEDAPLPYKLYRGLPEIALNTEIPLTLKRREDGLNPSLQELGHFLWYVYGLTHYSQSALFDGTKEMNVSFTQSLRRFVPSGGALYPNELYVYVKLDGAPEGIYHYDVAHHRLVLLREGNYDSYLSRSIDPSLSDSDCFCTIFVSTVFWKNFYKYNNFSYRLQGLDAGVVIGQSLEAAGRMGFSSRVYYQFLDRAVNHLLGLSDQEESVYAVIGLSMESPLTGADNDQKSEHMVSASELCREVPAVTHHSYNRSKRVIDYPMLRKLNDVSMFETKKSFVKLKKNNNKEFPLGTEINLLPPAESLSFDFASVCRKRYSPESDFTLEKVNQTQLSALLKEIFSFSYHNDLDDTKGQIETRVSLYGSFYNVEGIPNGAYSYDAKTHVLRRISKGDYREFLQYGLTLPNVNMYQVPLCFHLVGEKDHLKEILGYRGYRIQQMEAGILVQRLLLVSCALGMGGHPLLGFDAKQCDELYRIDSKGKTSLIQIPVGPYRSRAWLKGSLLS